MTTYAEHYKKCCDIGGFSPTKYSCLYDLIVDTELFDTNEQYHKLIQGIHTKVSEKIDKERGCYCDPHAIRLNEWQDITEVSALAQMLLPQVEQKVFGCYASVDFVHIYRSIPGNDEPTASWLWHYDDCPKEFLKLMIYLNDVDEDSGCFRILIDKDGNFPVIPTYRLSTAKGGRSQKSQVYDASRIPQHVILEAVEEGGKILNVTGPAGTYALITPNIYHRATIPKPGCKNPRDVLFFFIRPCLQKKEKYIDKNTGSFRPTRNVKTYRLN